MTDEEFKKEVLSRLNSIIIIIVCIEFILALICIK